MPFYPKFQNNICKSLLKCGKKITKYLAGPKFYTKNVNCGTNLIHLPKISTQQRLFYQTLDCHLQKLIKI